MAVGKDPQETLRDFCRTAGIPEPHLGPVTLERWEVLTWFRRGKEDPFVVTFEPGKTEHKRHIRKYAEGDLGDGSFVFTGPGKHLHLRAQNLNNFIRMASGVDDGTWTHHLREHDYSQWFRNTMKDYDLADEVEAVENGNGSARESRERIFAAIRSKYTAPA